MDIHFKTPVGRFSYRVAAVLLRDEKVLTQRAEPDAHLALPGGRAKLGEDSVMALKRELHEELGVAPESLSLVWTTENIFTLDGEPFHELGFYYVVDKATVDELPEADWRWTDPESGLVIAFEWQRLDRLDELPLHPRFLRERLLGISGSAPSPEHVIIMEGVSNLEQRLV